MPGESQKIMGRRENEIPAATFTVSCYVDHSKLHEPSGSGETNENELFSYVSAELKSALADLVADPEADWADKNIRLEIQQVS